MDNLNEQLTKRDNGTAFRAPTGRTFQRVKVPRPPDSGKDIAKSKGVSGN